MRGHAADLLLVLEGEVTSESRGVNQEGGWGGVNGVTDGFIIRGHKETRGNDAVFS